jgi:cytochrome c-type biogenesis protein CcmH/NrfG
MRHHSARARTCALVVLFVGSAFLTALWSTRPPVQQSSAASSVATGIAEREQWTRQAQRADEQNPSIDIDALTRQLIEHGSAALAQGDLKTGFEAYRRAVEYNPNAETHGLVGDLYLRTAVASEAAFHLRRAADLEPNNADRWLALANVYILKADLGAAWKAIERAKGVDPGLVVARDKDNFVVRRHAG